MTNPDTLSLLRRGLLALLALGCIGTLSELILLKHYEEWQQFIPLTLLTLTLLVIVWHWTRGDRQSVRTLQVLGLLLVIGGTIGVGLHFLGNVEAEQELNPGTAGLALLQEVVRGDAPALAPGTLVQFGLLALLYAYRHPALQTGRE
jgi:drug/metabolite transporter (DMT)-like permease